MALLEIRDITKSFGRTEVLKGISFDVNKGETVSIIGSSGSGKTTLLRCINYLETPDTGRFILNGEEVFNAERDKKMNEREKRERRLHFGLVFQQFNLFPQYTTFKNVTLAAELLVKKKMKKAGATKAEIKNSIEEVRFNASDILQSVGLSDKKDNYPCQLSGGQQQRVAIARALALEPEILCFDEPTSALDPELTGEVLAVIRELASRNMTMIVVTHEMSFARNVSDKIIFMDQGVIAEAGSPEYIFEQTSNERIVKFLNSINK